MTIYPLFGNFNPLKDEIRKIGCSEISFPIFRNKFDIIPIKIAPVKSPLANIIKQEMISSKGDAAVHEKAISCKVENTDVILLGSLSMYHEFIRKMEYQQYPTLLELAAELKKMLPRFSAPLAQRKTRNGKTIDYSRPVIMGILNITGDSFYDGGKYLQIDDALKQCEKMIAGGASIIDVGGESSRPGAQPLEVNAEMERVIPVIEKISQNMTAVLSVDTYKAEVAEEAMKAGADIINDISAMKADENMAGVSLKYNADIILMHMKGSPKDMQKNPFYHDVLKEIIDFFDERIGTLTKKGIREEKIIIDPGIGFGKRLEDNLTLIRNLSSFRKFGMPILIGASRKSMIGMVLDKDRNAAEVPPEDRLFGTLGVHATAYFNGASIFRVHDVPEHSEMLKLISAIQVKN